MIILNTTTIVTWNIHEPWKQWMLEEQIPAILSTGLCSHVQMVRLLEVEEQEGPTYAVQLYVKTASLLNEYKEKHLERFSLIEQNRWGDDTYSFLSVMEVIN